MTTATKPEAPRYVARIPNTRHGRATLAGLRRYANRDAGALRVLFSGPRTRGQHATRRADATDFRVYFYHEETDRALRRAWAAEAALRDARADAHRRIAELESRAEDAEGRALAAEQVMRGAQADRERMRNTLHAMPRGLWANLCAAFFSLFARRVSS